MIQEAFFEQFDSLTHASNAMAKLRELVLRLAFSGRLTGTRREQGSVTDGWEKRTIGSICSSITPGFACSRNHQVEDGHVHLRTHNISTLGTLNFDLLVRIDPQMVDPQKSSIRSGDILFNNTNSQELVGKTSLVDRDYDYAFSNHITRLRIKEGVDPRFVVFYLTLLRNSGYFAKICTRWINQAAVNTETLKVQTIHLPSLGEQKRIAGKIDELMELCDRLDVQRREQEEQSDRLARASLARFDESPTLTNLHYLFHTSYDIAPSDLRKSIIALGIQGKLVPQDPEDAPADMGDIQVERELVGSDSCDISRPVEKSETPFSLPRSWKWVRLGVLANIKHGYAFSSESFTNEPTQFVLTTPGNFFEAGGFRDRGPNTKYYTGEVPPDFVLSPGDLIIPMTEQAAGLLGSPAFIPDDGKTYLHNQRLGKLEFQSDDVDPEFVFWFFNSSFFRNELARTCTGMKVRHTSPKRVLKVPFPLCSFAEQRRIVAKVNELMALVDALESQTDAVNTTAVKLIDAFVQELVSGEANDAAEVRP